MNIPMYTEPEDKEFFWSVTQQDINLFYMMNNSMKRTLPDKDNDVLPITKRRI